jgi:putative hydrolase of the HAD superfamily
LTEAIRLFYYDKQPGLFESCTPESDREFWRELYTFVLQKLGADEVWSDDEIHQYSHELYDIYTAPEHYHLFDDVIESLTRLKQMGLRLGIISNFAPTLQAVLESKGIAHFFELVIVSTEVGLEKPDPAIFKLAIQRCGLAPEDLLYIGDHEINDIWAPRQVGIEAVQIVRYNQQAAGKGIHSLIELLP